MEDSWAIFTDDLEDEIPIQRPSFLPSSLNKEYIDPQPFYQQNVSNVTERKLSYGFETPTEQPYTPFIVPESAPSSSYQMSFASPTFSSQAEPDRPQIPQQQETTMYATVSFRPTRNEIFKYKSSLNLKPGDYVITEADRGFDIGTVSKTSSRVKSHEARTARNILRAASDAEIRQIPTKVQKEKRATEICQQKASELGLAMTITDTEFQFDGKKLTVYFSAKQYIDFRDLVRVLFKIFETRIWMVWFDGTAPVKDVFEQRKPPITNRKF
jgi:hypothetical protein